MFGIVPELLYLWFGLNAVLDGILNHVGIVLYPLLHVVGCILQTRKIVLGGVGEDRGQSGVARYDDEPLLARGENVDVRLLDELQIAAPELLLSIDKRQCRFARFLFRDGLLSCQ